MKRELWERKTPEERARFVATIKAYWAKYRVAHPKKPTLTPEECRRKSGEASRAYWAKYRAEHPKKPRPVASPEETRKKRSESGRARWAKFHAEHPKKPKVYKKPPVLLTLNGVTHTQSEWARILGLKVVTIFVRRKKGWPVERVLEPTHDRHDPKPRRINGL